MSNNISEKNTRKDYVRGRLRRILFRLNILFSICMGFVFALSGFGKENTTTLSLIIFLAFIISLIISKKQGEKWSIVILLLPYLVWLLCMPLE